MDTQCSTHRSQIPRAALGELSFDEHRTLEAHISECAPCARELSSYAETIRQLSAAGDVAVPRHFFVYRDQQPLNPWRVFLEMTAAWKAGFAALALAVLALCVSAAARIQIRAEGDSYVVSFGKPTETQSPSPAVAVDSAALRADLRRAIEQKVHADKLELVRTLRLELAQSNVSVAQRQRTLLDQALSDLESRINDRLVATADTLEVGAERSLASLYRAIAVQRERDLTVVNDRLNRIAATGESNNNQTDAILETLLQVAELRIK